MGPFKHLVVIYEENHSFDNLYGGWGKVDGQQVDGLRRLGRARRPAAQDGTAYRCLRQNDVNLTVAAAVGDVHGPRARVPASHFTNRPFTIDDYISRDDTTCPAPRHVRCRTACSRAPVRPGGCTRDLVHRFYQEQYQIDGGQQDRYVTGSDAIGLTMGPYDTRQLPIYHYLHGAGAPTT